MADAESGGAARFSCPPDFAATPAASELPRFSLEALIGPDTELWLIRAPADFAPDCLNGRLVPLSGSRIVKGKLAGKRRRYRVFSSSGPQAGEATLLAPSAEVDGGLTCAPAPQGSLRIFEGPQESPSGTPLQPIPTSLPPQIPPGLKPRFCAFGGSPPVTGLGSALALKTPASRKKKRKRQVPEASVPQEAVNGHCSLEVDTAVGSLEMSVGKKKRQQLKEPEVMEPFSPEPAAEILGPPGVPQPFTTKKRKKQLREGEVVKLETQLLEPEEKAVELELVVKTEPPEETVLSPRKKRKRQKGAEGTEPVEGTRVDSPLPVKVEPQEEAIPLPSVKMKKGKRYKVTAERGTEVVKPEMSPVELCWETTEPELPVDMAPPPTEAAPLSTRKKRKKEKGQTATMEPGTELQGEVVVPEQPGDPEPQAAVASTKKRKKERGQKAVEPKTEVTDPPGQKMEPGLQDVGEAQEKVPQPLLSLEPGEVPAGGRQKQRKKHLQQGPVWSPPGKAGS